MARTFSLGAVAALLGAVSAQGPSTQCSEAFGCYFRVNQNASVAIGYDLCGLCLDDGSAYTYTDGATGAVYSVNVGAYTPAYCAWKDTTGEYVPVASFGVAAQFLPSGSPPTGTCTASNGSALPCTDPCEVLTGAGGPLPSLLDSEAPTAGVLLSFPPAPASAQDPFLCPLDPASGLPAQRTLAVAVACDPAIPGLAITGVKEVASCAYVMSAASAAGCGTRIPRA